MKLTEDIRAIDKQISANDAIVAGAQAETAELKSKRDRLLAILTDDEKAELNPPADVAADITLKVAVAVE
jgi:hypothetical protein